MHWDADNVNRLGMVLGFVSFWLAAPEILGEQRLIVIEKFFEKSLYIIIFVACLLFLPYALYKMSNLLFYELLSPEKEQLFHPLSSVGLLRFVTFYGNTSVLSVGVLISQNFLIARNPVILLAGKSKYWSIMMNMMNMMNILVRILVLMTIIITMIFIFITSSPKMQVVTFLWAHVKPSILVTISLIAVVALGPRLIIMLADDAKARQRFLALGAVFFILSFILQFTATFMTNGTS